MLTQKRLKELLRYDPATGVFVRRVKCGNAGAKAGDVAGYKKFYPKANRHYWHITVAGEDYGAHRLAWLYMTGKWPHLIDHINRNSTDNRFSNLREADHSSNAMNRDLNKNSSTGVRGVNRWHGRYSARKTVNGKRNHLGVFDTVEAAAKALEIA